MFAQYHCSTAVTEIATGSRDTRSWPITTALALWLACGLSASSAIAENKLELTTSGAAHMPLISRGAPAYASSGSAEQANDENYNTAWRSSGVPATLAYDLSAVATIDRQMILVSWSNDATYGYDHELLHQVGYNNPRNYVLEANAAQGGRRPPSAGWVTVATTTNNTLHSKEHLLSFAGYNWLRMRATAADGSAGNADIMLNLDVYGLTAAEPDGWFFAGDSITANGMGHTNLPGAAAASFSEQVARLTGRFPPQENAGMPGWTTVDLLNRLPDWLNSFPGKYVTLNLGTNDAAGAVAPRVFYSNMANLIKGVLARGKIPVVPTIPWSPDKVHAANIPGLNAQIRKLYQGFPRVVPGPDLFTFFKGHPELISSDQIHPTDFGYAALRAFWANFAAQATNVPVARQHPE